MKNATEDSLVSKSEKEDEEPVLGTVISSKTQAQTSTYKSTGETNVTKSILKPSQDRSNNNLALKTSSRTANSKQRHPLL